MPRSIDRINNYLDYEFRSIALPTTSGSFFINLSTTMFDGSGSGSVLVPTGQYNYEEVILQKNEENWAETSLGELTNSNTIDFPSGSMVSSGDWGTIAGVMLSDFPQGNPACVPIYFYNLPTFIEINVGGKLTFEGGALKFKRVRR